MKTSLYLVRHGQTDWNSQGRYQGQLDIPLNSRGREQAHLLAKKFQQKPLDVVWASDLLRAKETATIIASLWNLQVLTHEGLREMHFGQWQGMTWQEIADRYPKSWQQWVDNPLSYEIPDSEGLLNMEKRFAKTLHRICADSIGQRILVVAHGGPIARFLTSLTDDNFWERIQNNCTCNILSFSQNKFTFEGLLAD